LIEIFQLNFFGTGEEDNSNQAASGTANASKYGVALSSSTKMTKALNHVNEMNHFIVEVKNDSA
jgi:hypothetical protein